MDISPVLSKARGIIQRLNRAVDNDYAEIRVEVDPVPEEWIRMMKMNLADCELLVELLSNDKRHYTDYDVDTYNKQARKFMVENRRENLSVLFNEIEWIQIENRLLRCYTEIKNNRDIVLKMLHENAKKHRFLFVFYEVVNVAEFAQQMIEMLQPGADKTITPDDAARRIAFMKDTLKQLIEDNDILDKFMEVRKYDCAQMIGLIKQYYPRK